MTAEVAGDGRGQGADGGDLVDDDEHRAVFGLQFGEGLAEPGFTAGQPAVDGLLPGRSECGGVVFALADVQAEVDVDVAGIDHVRCPPVVPTRPCHGTDRRIHMTESLPTWENAGG